MAEIEVPYVDKMVRTSEEAGPVTPENLFTLVEMAPTSSPTGYFNMSLILGKGSIPRSTASIVVGLDTKRIALQEVCVDCSFEEALCGGRLERLSLRLPVFNSGKGGFSFAGNALGIFKAELPKLRDAGYTIAQDGFVLGHDMVQVPDAHPGFFCSSYAGKVAITTAELIKGRPERKFVLSYTPDMKDSSEAKVYRGFLGSIK